MQVQVSSNGKIRRTESEWREILAEFESSGLSHAAFCKRDGIAEASFAKWRLRLSKASGAEGSFVELPVSSGTSARELLLSLPGGVTLRWTF